MLETIIETSSVYCLISLGLYWFYGIGRVVNFAHGHLFVMGMYGHIFFVNGINLFMPAPISFMLSMVVISALFTIIFYGLQSVVEKIDQHNHYSQFVGMAGFAVIISAAQLIFFGESAMNLAHEFHISPIYMLIFLGVYFVGSYLILYKTTIGLILRGFSESPKIMQSLHFDSRKNKKIIALITAVLFSTLSLLCLSQLDAHPNLGQNLTLISFVIVLGANVKRLELVLLLGIGLGVLEVGTSVYCSPAYKALPAMIILLVLLARISINQQKAIRKI